MAIIKDKDYKPNAGYVGVCRTKDQNYVHVWERNDLGERIRNTFPIYPYFYINDPYEDKTEEYKFTTIFGDIARKEEFSSAKKSKERKDSISQENKRRKDAGKKKVDLIKTFESDFNPLDRVLMDYYYNAPVPKLHTAFIDIETDYDPERQFSKPCFEQNNNPDDKSKIVDSHVIYAPINAITIYKQWKNEYVTIVVPPKGFTDELPKTISLSDLGSDVVARLISAEDETQLLKETFREILHADILSGWNSEFFDMPYLVMRTQILEEAGKSISVDMWALEGARNPTYGSVEVFGSEKPTVNMSDTGRSHLDYLRLFQKFTFEGRTSYALAAIAEEELDIPKLEYEGSLADLYNNDFIHFIKYNIRDVEILHRLDDKFKFINLANMMSHENTVLIDAVLGTVKYVETGLSNYAHRVLGKIVGDRLPAHATEKVEGAIVLTPKIGLHDWVGSVDINSLYPSVIRSLNISPEKIIGQFLECEAAWNGIKTNSDDTFTLKLEDGEKVSMAGKDWKILCNEQKWAISAYGTIFDQSNGKGLIPIVLEEWYFGRKKLQAEKKKWTKERKRFEDDGDTKSAEYLHAKTQEEYFDLLQLTRKIQLNSCYGALLNAFFRFFRMEMGASVTATGRQITTHMMGTIGELLTGIFSLLKSYTEINKDGSVSKFYETDAESPVIYGDTDSAYFKTYANNKKDAVEIADAIADGVNESFTSFMINSFNCQAPDFHDLIKAGREIVAIRGLFQAKKKYMLKVVDLEGVATDKLKSMGSEIKKADTPKPIQKFLKNTVDLILDGKEFAEVEKHVNIQRKKLFSKSSYNDIIHLGVARSANNFESQYNDFKRFELTGKHRVRLPGHIRASVNYNELALLEEGQGASLIQSGDKVKVFYLLPNARKIKSIAFPSDISKFPKWFDDQYKVDVKLTEEKMIDAKLEGIFSAWGYEVPTVQGEFLKTLIDF